MKLRKSYFIAVVLGGVLLIEDGKAMQVASAVHLPKQHQNSPRQVNSFHGSSSSGKALAKGISRSMMKMQKGQSAFKTRSTEHQQESHEGGHGGRRFAHERRENRREGHEHGRREHGRESTHERREGHERGRRSERENRTAGDSKDTSSEKKGKSRETAGMDVGTNNLIPGSTEAEVIQIPANEKVEAGTYYKDSNGNISQATVRSVGGNPVSQTGNPTLPSSNLGDLSQYKVGQIITSGDQKEYIISAPGVAVPHVSSASSADEANQKI